MESELNWKSIYIALINNFKLVLLCSVLGAIIAGSYSLYVPDKYQSKIILAPVSQDEASPVPNSYMSLASLAGVSLPTSGNSRISEATAIISSYKFFSEIFIDDKKIFELMAAKKWNKALRNLEFIDPYSNVMDLTKTEREALMQDFSLQEAYKEFTEKFKVDIDKDNGFLTLSFIHISPDISKEWLNEIVSKLNKTIKINEKDKATKAINYLNKQISKTGLTEVKQVLSQLIQEQTQTIMLAEVNEEYIFKVIEPAIAPEERDSPNRLYMVIFGILLGLSISALIILVNKINFKEV